MKLNINQFDDGGGSDTVSSAPPAAPVRDDSDDRMARAAASRAREVSASSGYTNPNPGYTNTTTAAGIAAASGASSMYSSGPAAAETSKAAKPKAPKAIDKSNWDKSTKVSQSTVDAVKDAGRGNMGKVPQRIVKNDAIGLSAPGYVGSQLQYNAPVSKEYKEATKRVYPNEVKTPKTPTFNESSPNAKPYPKIAAPKTNINKVKELRNKEISDANNKGTALNDRVAYAIINGLKGGASAYGAGTQKYSQIPGTQTKTQKAQADYKANLAANKTAAASKPAAATGKIKVSQATVDSVKSQGKATAIKNAQSNVTNAEYKEAVKRIYQSPAKPKPKTKSGGGGGGKTTTAVK
jgi:hypothetical protein